MTLRVYLRQSDGQTSYIDYGLNADIYDGIIKTEIRTETSKVKTYSGSKWVGIPEIDNDTKPKSKTKKKTTKTPEYSIFNWRTHDTDLKFYWVSALCSNCNESAQVAIPQGQKIDKRGFKSLVCPNCGVVNALSYARYNPTTKNYVRPTK